MPRVKLSIQNNYPYQINIPVRITDINYGRHLGNDSLVSLIHEARFRFIQDLGFLDEIDAGIIIQDLCVQYKSEVFCNDKLAIHIAIGEVENCSLRMFYKIVNSEKKVVAIAETGIVFIDYNTKKVKSIPEKFLGQS